MPTLFFASAITRSLAPYFQQVATSMTPSEYASSPVPGAAREAYRRLFVWLGTHEYRGYDPYDGLSTRWGTLRRGKYARLLTVYANKLSPLNLRPAFRVPRQRDHQALGLVVSAALRSPPPVEVPVDALIAEIMEGSLRREQGLHCWNGHPFPVQMRHYYRPPTVPEIIGTEACATALMDLRRRDPSATWVDEVLREVRAFCLERLFSRFGDAAFFHYSVSTAPHLCTYNASSIAARLVLEVNAALGEDEGRSEVDAAIAFIVERQREDGAWMYRIDLRSGAEKPQIDFHQGFVIDSLLRYLELAPGGVAVREAIDRGVDFYGTRQFLPSGRGLHRYPRRWPVNIQNQAQGVVTFTRAAALDPRNLDVARRILAWTLSAMQDAAGYFHYLKYPVGANRIPYLRWSNASMAFALATFLEVEEARC